MMRLKIRHITDAERDRLNGTPGIDRDGTVLDPAPDKMIYGWVSTTGKVYGGQGYPIPDHRFRPDREVCAAIIVMDATAEAFNTEPTVKVEKAIAALTELTAFLRGERP